ncbi:MAG: IgGFc-binding protein, partial [Myxococcales bacterium]|nr:IgGFc-binding protein [Myxococcales bacterium]
TYPTTNLVLTRVDTGSGFKDVNIDCIGTVTGWQPAGSGGRYEMTNVDLIRGGTPNGSCANGPHVAESEGVFGITVWGLDTYSSYGYPAGGSVSTINDVVVIPVPD